MQTGHGTFIDEREIVTAGRAVELATDIAHASNGVPAVMHMSCASRFVVRGRFRWGDIALLEKVEPIDPDSTISDAVWMTARVPKQRANLSPRCFLGQNLTFFHAPEAHASFRETLGYELETATVSFQRHDRQAVPAKALRLAVPHGSLPALAVGIQGIIPPTETRYRARPGDPVAGC